MSLKALGVAVAAAVIAALFIILPSGGGSPRPGLTVSPARGDPRTTFTFTFRAPASGSSARTRLGYTLGLSGPLASGCRSAHSSPVAPARRGVDVTARVGPVQLGGSWCPGAYEATVTEFAIAACPTGAMCPQFIRIVGIVARAGFVVGGPDPAD